MNTLMRFIAFIFLIVAPSLDAAGYYIDCDNRKCTDAEKSMSELFKGSTKVPEHFEMISSNLNYKLISQGKVIDKYTIEGNRIYTILYKKELFAPHFLLF